MKKNARRVDKKKLKNCWALIDEYQKGSCKEIDFHILFSKEKNIYNRTYNRIS